MFCGGLMISVDNIALELFPLSADDWINHKERITKDICRQFDKIRRFIQNGPLASLIIVFKDERW